VCPLDGNWTSHHEERWKALHKSLDKQLFFVPMRQMKLALRLVVEAREPQQFIGWLKASGFPTADPGVKSFGEIAFNPDLFSYSFLASKFSFLPLKESQWSSLRHVEVIDMGNERLEVSISCAPAFVDLVAPMLDAVSPSYKVVSAEGPASDISVEPRIGGPVGEKHRPGGRPRNPDDDWACREVRQKNRPPHEVYPEWKERIGSRYDNLMDPQESFKKATSRSRWNRIQELDKRKEGRKEGE